MIDDSPATDSERIIVDPRHAVQQVALERDRDQLLDLGRGQPERLGLDLDVRRRELGKHVHRHGAELRSANDEQPRTATSTTEMTKPQAPADEPTHQRDLPLCRDHLSCASANTGRA